MLPGDLAHPSGRREGHRAAEIARREQNRAAERSRVGPIQGQGLVEFGFRLPADAHLRARLQAEPAIARAIRKQLGLDAVKMLCLVASGENALDSALPHLRAAAGGSNSSVMFGSDFTLS